MTGEKGAFPKEQQMSEKFGSLASLKTGFLKKFFVFKTKQ